MGVIRGRERPVQRRGTPWPLLQKLVNHEVGATQLSIYLNESAPGEEVRAHAHDVEEVLYVSQGAMIATIEGQEHHAEAGDAILVPAGVVHAFRNPGPDHLTSLGILASARAETMWADPADQSGLHLDQLADR